VFRVLSEQGLTAIGPPFARFHFVAEGRCEAEAGFPVATEIAAEGDVIPSVLPGGLAATTVHIGPYEAMGPAYESLSSWVEEQNGEATGNAWEVYFSDPNAQPDPATWKTVIVQPYRLKEDAA
jgi:effector-binding domain-containing protein